MATECKILNIFQVSNVKENPLNSDEKITAPIEKGSSSGDSEITTKDAQKKKRISSELVSPNVQSPVVKKKATKTAKEKAKKEPKSKKELSSDGQAELLNDTTKNSESTSKLIKDVFLKTSSKPKSNNIESVLLIYIFL